MRRKESETIAVTEVNATVNWVHAYEAYARDLLGFLRRTTGNQATAEDLLHEAFARAIASTTPVGVGDARPWLFKIAANLAASHLRRRRLLTFVALRSVHSSAPEAFDIEGEHVRRALRSIPPDQAICLTLALHQGFTRREIAEMLRVSEETIKSRLARGRRNFAAAYRRLERGLAR